MIARTLAENWSHVGLTSLGLVIFFTIFCFAAFGIFRTASQEKFETESRLPLQDDAVNEVSHVG